MAVPPLADAMETLLEEMKRFVAQEGAAVSPAADEFDPNYAAEKWPRQPSGQRSSPSPSPRATRGRAMTHSGMEPVHPAWPEFTAHPRKMHGDPLWTALQKLHQHQARAPSPHSPYSSPSQQRWHQAQAPSPRSLPSLPSQQLWPHWPHEEDVFELESSVGSVPTGHSGGHDSGAGLLSADHTGGHESHVREKHSAGTVWLDVVTAQRESKEVAERKKAAAQNKGKAAVREEGAERK